MRAAMPEFLRKFSTTSQLGGKSVFRQMQEALRLRLRASPLGIGEYIDYGLWQRSVTSAMQDEFIGWRQSAELDQLFNDDYARVLANDKLLNYLVLHAAGYPIPAPVATYTPEGRGIAGETVLRSEAEVLDFLAGDVYPLYVKPISAGYGHGVMGLQGREGEGYRQMDGSVIGREQLLEPFRFVPYRGMLFQKPLKAHPAIVELTGSEAVSCVRFICFVTRQGPVIHTAFWKIVAGKNMMDNFSHGDYGNCLGAIDLDTGRIVRAIAKMGPGGGIDQHPSTGRPLVGFQLPDWRQASDLVLAASRHFPGLRLQNWDVCLTPDGPYLLELNTESELNVPQAISGRGFKDARLRAILADLEAGKEAYRRAVASRNGG